MLRNQRKRANTNTSNNNPKNTNNNNPKKQMNEKFIWPTEKREHHQ